MPSLSGLQIIDWSPEYMGVNKRVVEHMKYMNKHNKWKLCYMPLHKMEGSCKYSFLNTQSLHCHIKDVQGSRVCSVKHVCHLMIWIQIIKFADIVRHDETTGNKSQSFHGLAAYYVKDHLHLCEIHKQWNEGF